jgi:hypothetical protein
MSARTGLDVLVVSGAEDGEARSGSTRERRIAIEGDE